MYGDYFFTAQLRLIALWKIMNKKKKVDKKYWFLWFLERKNDKVYKRISKNNLMVVNNRHDKTEKKKSCVFFLNLNFRFSRIYLLIKFFIKFTVNAVGKNFYIKLKIISPSLFLCMWTKLLEIVPSAWVI